MDDMTASWPDVMVLEPPLRPQQLCRPLIEPLHLVCLKEQRHSPHVAAGGAPPIPPVVYRIPPHHLVCHEQTQAAVQENPARASVFIDCDHRGKEEVVSDPRRACARQ